GLGAGRCRHAELGIVRIRFVLDGLGSVGVISGGYCQWAGRYGGLRARVSPDGFRCRGLAAYVSTAKTAFAWHMDFRTRRISVCCTPPGQRARSGLVATSQVTVGEVGRDCSRTPVNP